MFQIPDEVSLALSLPDHLSSILGPKQPFTPDLSPLIGSAVNVLTFLNYTASPEMAFNVKPLQSLRILLSACQMAICSGMEFAGISFSRPLVF
ncbi:hypothetical protein AVEN_81383-1 [Araneus ventricosus]|uniref:Uncharacterized protein n=1 Tax=Araneus ventricosus TaxID=182803 RepID=A0A4Y2B8Q1_ARAVE|nr:hypothetical protein AVEN_81383-1 [Araneus ventricosus]